LTDVPGAGWLEPINELGRGLFGIWTPPCGRAWSYIIVRRGGSATSGRINFVPEKANSHPSWIAELSLTHKEIIGLYLNDFYEETEETAKGGRSAEEFRQIIAKAKSINPRPAIWPPATRPAIWTSRTTSTSTPSSSTSTTLPSCKTTSSCSSGC
jgi:hypothetical protein